jgi:putative heme-binding domain-containing protein
VTYGNPKPVAAPDLTKMTNKELLEQIEKPKNGWYARMAARVLSERVLKENRDPERLLKRIQDGSKDEVVGTLEKLLSGNNPEVTLRAFSTIWQGQIIIDPTTVSGRTRKNEDVMRLVLNLTTERMPLDTPTGTVRVAEKIGLLEGLALGMALQPPKEFDEQLNSSRVRVTYASLLQRLPVAQRPRFAAVLLTRAEDANDPNMPFLIWYGLIPVAEKDPMALVPLAAEGKMPKVREWIARRLGEMMPKNPKPINELLARVKDQPEAVRRDVVVGLSVGLAGVRKIDTPEAWKGFSKEFTGADGAKMKSLVQGLDVVFGDGRALDEVRKVALDGKADLNSRKAALQTLVDANPPDLRTVCEQLLKVRFLNIVALRGLVTFDEPAVAKVIAGSFRTFHPSERAAVIDALASRPTFASELLELLGNGTVPRTELTASQARQIRGFDDAKLTKRLTEVWGEFRDSPKDKADLMAKLKTELSRDTLGQASRPKGREVFAKTCANCHRLFGSGGEIGPDLTGAGRKDIDYLLSNVVDPSAVVTKDFQMTRFALADGRSVSGVVVAETPTAVTVQTEKEREVLSKGDIEKRTPSNLSLMPDGLLNTLSPEQIRDLIAYLMSETQVELPVEKK